MFLHAERLVTLYDDASPLLSRLCNNKWGLYLGTLTSGDTTCDKLVAIAGIMNKIGKWEQLSNFPRQ